MDQGEKIIKEKNPRETASILSTVFFGFTKPILTKGRKRDLQEKDVYQILSKFESEKLGNALESYWNKGCQKPEQEITSDQINDYHYTDNSQEKTYPSIFGCLVKCFGWFYLFLGFIQLFMRTALIFLQPTALSKFIAYFEKDQTAITSSEVCGYAFLVIGLSFGNCIYNHNYQQMIMEYAVRVRTALCSLIYRKALKLNPVTFSESYMGKVVTLITKDVYCIDGAMTFLNDMWIGVVQTIIITVLLYRRVGYSVFVGIGFFILIIPLQSYCGRKFSLTRLTAAKKAEERIQLVKEALNAIKIIKMYTWEHYFEKLITAARM